MDEVTGGVRLFPPVTFALACFWGTWERTCEGLPGDGSISSCKTQNVGAGGVITPLTHVERRVCLLIVAPEQQRHQTTDLVVASPGNSLKHERHPSVAAPPPIRAWASLASKARGPSPFWRRLPRRGGVEEQLSGLQWLRGHGVNNLPSVALPSVPVWVSGVRDPLLPLHLLASVCSACRLGHAPHATVLFSFHVSPPLVLTEGLPDSWGALDAASFLGKDNK